MSMFINHNLGSMNALSALNQNGNALQAALKQLSTGKRINSAADDAAGLSISQKMQGQINGLDQASRNAQDGISMIQTAEGALGQTQDILQRMRQLAVQASNGTNTSTDTASIQQEMNQLTSEINRIGNTTNFNTQSLLQGSTAAAVTTAAQNTTLTQGQTGVAAGALSSLSTISKSVVGVSSTTTLQGQTSQATGAVGGFQTTQSSIAGAKSSATLANGMVFTANSIGTGSGTIDGQNIAITQATTANATSSMSYNSSTSTYTITIGTDANNQSLAKDQGTLFNQVSSAISNYNTANPTSQAGFTVATPVNTATPVTNVASSGQFVGGKNQQAGTYQFDVSQAFREAGDSVTVGGQTFTAVTGTANASKGQFQIDQSAAFSITGSNNVITNAQFGATGQKAQWASTALTGALTSGGSGTFTFGGVTVNISADAANGTGGTISNVGNGSVNLLIHTGSDSNATSQMHDIALALQNYQANANGGNNELTGLTIGDSSGTFTAQSNANTTKFNDYTFISTGLTGVQTTATAASTLGTTATDGTSSATFTVDGKAFTLSNTVLNTASNWTSKANIASMVQGALASDGTTALSTVANVTTNGNQLVITDKSTGSTTSVQFNASGTGAADIQSALGITDGAKDNLAVEQGKSLVSAINANSTLSGRFGTAAIGANGVITLTEAAGQATGQDLTAPTVAGSGANNILSITDAGGQNLQTVNLRQAGTTAAAASTGQIDSSWQLSGVSAGTELNGLVVKFGAITTGGSNNGTAAFDKTSDTINVSGDFTGSTDIVKAINGALKNAGFSDTVQASGTFSTSTVDASNKTLAFGGGQISTSADQMAVSSDSKGNLTVYLATQTPTKNSAANIQSAIQQLASTGQYTGGIDLSKYTVSSSGAWDTTETGSDINNAVGTLVGGTQAVDGTYSTTIAKAFQAGDTVNIKGQTFTAVNSGADSTKGQFNVSGGDINAQASSLRDAISQNQALGGQYQVSAVNGTITLKENQASGTDLKTTDLGVTATGVQGQYSVSANQLLTDGGSFSIDGQKISVSSAPQNVGYANGTAIQQAATVGQQTQELADAINKNANLNGKYTASVDNSGNLLLTQKVGNSNAPTVSQTTSTKGDFQASFQIGADAGQSMSIDIKDMRAAALGVSNDGSASTEQASDGKVASFVSTATVTNGTDNTNVEHSLDVSTSDKASAAISVLNDAINAVSQQRSALGAYQNRLQFTINNLGTASQNLTDAQSRITDVDMASEMATFTKDNVLQQAAVSMLAQANQQPQMVLKLLG